MQIIPKMYEGKVTHTRARAHTHTKNWLQIIMQWHSTQLA